MAFKTKQELTSITEGIRQETHSGAITAERLGSLLLHIIDSVLVLDGNKGLSENDLTDARLQVLEAALQETNIVDDISGNERVSGRKTTSPYAVNEAIKKAINDLKNTSPEALDTLKELADALGNDPNFATNIINQLSGKEPAFSKNTAFNKNFGTGSGEVAAGNSVVLKETLGVKLIDGGSGQKAPVISNPDGVSHGGIIIVGGEVGKEATSMSELGGTTGEDAMLVSDGDITLVSNIQNGISNKKIAQFKANGKLYVSGKEVKTKTMFSTSRSGWVRIAESNNDRSVGMYMVTANQGGKHNSLVFGASMTHGQNPSITILSNSTYGSGAITQIRIVRKSTYDKPKIEIYVNGTSSVEIKELESFGFYAIDPIAGSIPSGWTSTALSVPASGLKSTNYNLHSVAQSGNYNDLSNRPTIKTPREYGYLTDIQYVILGSNHLGSGNTTVANFYGSDKVCCYLQVEDTGGEIASIKAGFAKIDLI